MDTETADQNVDTAIDNSGAAETVESPAAEVSPATESGQEEQKRDKSADRSSRRIGRLLNERAELRATNKALESRLQALEAKFDQSSDAPSQERDLEAYLNGKHGSFKEASRAFIEDVRKDALAAAKAFVEKDRSASRAAEEKDRVIGSYKQSVRAFEKAHPDVTNFDEIDESVSSEIGNYGSLKREILNSDNPAALVYWLHQNPEELDALIDTDERRLGQKIGRIEARMQSRGSKKETPKPPLEIRGGGAHMTDDARAMQAAAEAGDFATFERLDRQAKEKAKASK